MNLFHKLQDVYFDAMQLWETLEAIPPECDCWDAEAHLAGQCCCVSAASGATGSEGALQQGCFARLESLNKNIEVLREDLHRERQQLRPEETAEVQRPVLLIENLVRNLDSTVELIEDRLKQFQATCAHADLQRVKESSGDLQARITKLNSLL